MRKTKQEFLTQCSEGVLARNRPPPPAPPRSRASGVPVPPYSRRPSTVFDWNERLMHRLSEEIIRLATEQRSEQIERQVRQAEEDLLRSMRVTTLQDSIAIDFESRPLSVSGVFQTCTA